MIAKATAKVRQTLIALLLFVVLFVCPSHIQQHYEIISWGNFFFLHIFFNSFDVRFFNHQHLVLAKYRRESFFLIIFVLAFFKRRFLKTFRELWANCINRNGFHLMQRFDPTSYVAIFLLSDQRSFRMFIFRRTKVIKVIYKAT